jgi:hypothetical protein
MILEIFKNWQVILVCIVIMIVLPIIFYVSSFDNRPVKIKRVRVRKKLDINLNKKVDNPVEEESGGEFDDEVEPDE